MPRHRIYEAAVLGVPDGMMGEMVGAVVVPERGAAFDVTAVVDYLGAPCRFRAQAAFEFRR